MIQKSQKIINRIFTIGEIVYDIIFKDGQPVAARPGGSMLNSAISLGRTGLPVSFTGTCGSDQVGDLIKKFLNDNNVDPSFLHQENSQSIIALAFLDDQNNASYSFYKGQVPPEPPPLPSPGHRDILLFGSFYSVSESTRNSAINLRKTASDRGALIMYDPNFRDSHLRELNEVKPYIEENILNSDIVRGSDEDFEVIFGTGTAGETWDLDCFRNCRALVYTRSSKGVDLCTPELNRHYPVPSIRPLSTIGAGDSFNAGIIRAFYVEGINNANISKCTSSQWDDIIKSGIEFSTAVCMSYDNYIPAS
ncbi:MAG: PfkB family carbohydrate kinase [Bacteroidales bacterium]